MLALLALPFMLLHLGASVQLHIVAEKKAISILADQDVENPAGYNFVGPSEGGACRQSNGEEPPYEHKGRSHPCAGGDAFSQCRSQDLVNYCATECNQDSNCHSFQVLHGRGDCLLYTGGESCDPHAASSEWWWKVYEKRQAAPLAQISGDAAKVEVLEELHKDQVLHTQLSQRCVWTTGEAGYIKSHKMYVNEYFGTRSTVEECKDLCDSISQCKSISYDEAGGTCVVNYCRIGDGKCFNEDPGDNTTQYYSCEVAPLAEISGDAAKVEALVEVHKDQVLHTQLTQRCVWTAGEAGYIKSHKMYVNEYFGTRSTVEECKDLCDSISTCKSINYDEAAGTCVVNYCRIGDGECFNEDPGDTTTQYYSCDAAPLAEISGDAAKVEALEEPHKDQVLHTQLTQRCVWTNGEAGYIKSHKMYVNEYFGTRSTVEECKDLCNSIFQCKSINYDEAGGTCVVNYCRIGDGECFNEDPGDTTTHYYSCED